MAETLSLISAISYMMAAVFLVMAVVLWLVFDMPGVIADLSGNSAKRAKNKRLKKNKQLNRARKKGKSRQDTNDFDGEAETVMLKKFSGTAPLDVAGARTKNNAEPVKIKLVQEIMCIHTDEVI